MVFKTEQEDFWAGAFGDDYTERNNGVNWLASNISLFSKILQNTGPVGSIIEFGCNRGLNLQALRSLLPQTELYGVEINEIAVKTIQDEMDIDVFLGSIFGFKPAKLYTLSLVKGVLIHLNPDRLAQAYEALYGSSDRFICIAEYYNPQPVAIPYRGHENRLFKRDFAGEMMDQYPDLKLVDYGFVYHKDPLFPQDDVNWFLLEKK